MNYLLDGKPIEWQELIERAKREGYTGDDYGVLYTSGAAKTLREHGHTVEENHESKKSL